MLDDLIPGPTKMFESNTDLRVRDYTDPARYDGSGEPPRRIVRSGYAAEGRLSA